MTENINLDIDESVKKYMKELKPYKGLKKDEERKLILDYKNNHNISSRNKVITSNLKYACKMANKYRNRGIPFSSLISEANDALIFALERYDGEKNVKLMSYAKWWIDQRLEQLLEKNDKMKFSDLPTEKESQTENNNVDYMNDIDEDGNEDGFGGAETYEPSYSVEFINLLSSVLDEREQRMIDMRYGRNEYDKEYTLDEIGKEFNLTKERCRQILEKAFLKMRSKAMTIDSEFLTK